MNNINDLLNVDMTDDACIMTQYDDEQRCYVVSIVMNIDTPHYTFNVCDDTQLTFVLYGIATLLFKRRLDDMYVDTSDDTTTYS